MVIYAAYYWTQTCHSVCIQTSNSQPFWHLWEVESARALGSCSPNSLFKFVMYTGRSDNDSRLNSSAFYSDIWMTVQLVIPTPITDGVGTLNTYSEYLLGIPTPSSLYSK